MATWKELGDGSLAAAKHLFSAGQYRSSVSRAYYAAYCALTSSLAQQGVAFGRGWNNPPHEQLPRLVRGNLQAPEWQRREINHALRRLRLHREDADYRPAAEVGQIVARDCLRDASMIIQRMEAADDPG